jgi:hypothetical protein
MNSTATADSPYLSSFVVASRNTSHPVYTSYLADGLGGFSTSYYVLGNNPAMIAAIAISMVLSVALAVATLVSSVFGFSHLTLLYKTEEARRVKELKVKINAKAKGEATGTAVEQVTVC